MQENFADDSQSKNSSDPDENEINDANEKSDVEIDIEKRYEKAYQSSTSKVIQQYDTVDIAKIKNLPPAKSFKGFMIGLSMLLGIPLVFGVLAQVFVGVLISQQVTNRLDSYELEAFKNLPWINIANVLIICAMIFMAGHIFNDIFELRTDRKTQKHKPLVNKSIPLWFAWILGLSFMIGAGLISYYQASRGTFLVVLLLAVAILLYAILAKQEKILAAVVIGVYNIIFIYLGASAVLVIPDDIINFKNFVDKEILWFYPAAIGIYLIGVTLVSTLEEIKPAPVRLTVSNLLILIGLIIPPGFTYVQIHLKGEIIQNMWEFPIITSMSLAGGVILVLVIVMTIALYDNTAKNLHRIFTVGRLGLIWLCASIIAGLGMPVTSLVIALMSVPAMMLYQQFPDPAKRRIFRA